MLITLLSSGGGLVRLSSSRRPRNGDLRMVRGTDIFDLTGKVAIVTGSTKGIGRSMVEGLAAAGASVVVSSRKQDLCETVAQEIEAATGADVLPLACHVGDWDAIPAFVEKVVERFGRIDVLVNNAGINPG